MRGAVSTVSGCGVTGPVLGAPSSSLPVWEVQAGGARPSPHSAGGVSDISRVQPPGPRMDLTQGGGLAVRPGAAHGQGGRWHPCQLGEGTGQYPRPGVAWLSAHRFLSVEVYV